MLGPQFQGVSPNIILHVSGEGGFGEDGADINI